MKIYGNPHRAIAATSSIPLPKGDRPLRDGRRPDSGLDWEAISPPPGERGPVLDHTQRGSRTGTRSGIRDSTRERNKSIIADYRDGISKDDLQAIYGVSYSTVITVLREAGLGSNRAPVEEARTDDRHCTVCGELLVRRAKERANLWNKRQTCSSRCAGKLAASRRNPDSSIPPRWFSM